MEQLSPEALKWLRELARQAEEVQAAMPWPAGRHSSRPLMPDLMPDWVPDWVPDVRPHPAPDALPPDETVQPEPRGIERRITRRAEMLWRRLSDSAECPGKDCPAAEALLRFLQPPFGASSLAIAMPPHPGDMQARQPRITHVGKALADLGLMNPEPPMAALMATLRASMLVLAGEALGTGQPQHLDSDAGSGRTDLGLGGEPILMRAVALPFAAAAGAGPCAIVVCSWRRLLSRHETDALHRELAATTDWLGDVTGGQAESR